MFKQLINLIFLIVLILMHISIFNVLPYFKYLNLVLLFVVYLTIKGDKSFLWTAVAAGYLLDLYSSYTFGVHILAIVGIAFLSNYIYFKILTNHRFFPVVILVSFCIVIYHFIISSTIFVLGFLKLLPKIAVINKIILKNIGLEILYTVLLISIIYIAFNMARKNLRSVFLPTTKH